MLRFRFSELGYDRSTDRLHAIFGLDCLDMLFPMLQWVDDMFYTP
jgi:hypothetical protein